MQLSRLRVLCLLMVGLLQGGCMAQNVNAEAGGAWRERCGTTNGWKFCFLVPPSTDEGRIGNGFRMIRGSDDSHIFGPWNSWTGKRWDGLVAVVSPADALSAHAADSQLLGWAGIWDEAQRKRDIAGGQSASSLPKPYKTRVLVDSRGRRWAFGERRWRELNLPYTRFEQMYVTPVGEGGLKLELSFECSHPHLNCGLIERMISGVRWDKAD